MCKTVTTTIALGMVAVSFAGILMMFTSAEPLPSDRKVFTNSVTPLPAESRAKLATMVAQRQGG